jgi:hypothetical protein
LVECSDISSNFCGDVFVVGQIADADLVYGGSDSDDDNDAACVEEAFGDGGGGIDVFDVDPEYIVGVAWDPTLPIYEGIVCDGEVGVAVVEEAVECEEERAEKKGEGGTIAEGVEFGRNVGLS